VQESRQLKGEMFTTLFLAQRIEEKEEMRNYRGVGLKEKENRPNEGSSFGEAMARRMPEPSSAS